jgi:hypothetical protein
MKAILVDRANGVECGWIEFRGDMIVVPEELIDQNVTTVGAFCGFEPGEPPSRIGII